MIRLRTFRPSRHIYFCKELLFIFPFFQTGAQRYRPHCVSPKYSEAFCFNFDVFNRATKELLIFLDGLQRYVHPAIRTKFLGIKVHKGLSKPVGYVVNQKCFKKRKQRYNTYAIASKLFQPLSS
jgi:hypothetical protein